MNEHYYTSTPQSEHKFHDLIYEFSDKKFKIKTDNGVFSKKEIDKGTEILLKNLPHINGKVVDMGCGYGIISIIVKTLYPNTDVYGIDINERALELAKYNAEINNVSVTFIQSDGLESCNLDGFDFAITNPPIRAGKSTVYRLFTELHKALNINGKLLIVMRTKQGAKSAIDYLKTLFNNVETIDIKSGYRIISCEGKTNDLQ